MDFVLFLFWDVDGDRVLVSELDWVNCLGVEMDERERERERR